MIFGSKVYRAQTVSNSMQWARENIELAPDGAIFIADRLEQAQGRQGRAWGIRDGQLLITAMLKPILLASCPDDERGIRLNQLSIALSLGIINPLLPHGASIKWPNDFYINNKKIGGMLLQPVWQGTTLRGIILGFGLNVTTIFSPDDELFEIATSITMETGKTIALRELYFALLSSLDHYYLRWQQQDYQALYSEWRKQQSFIGKQLIVHRQDGTIFNAKLNQVMPNGDAIMSSETHPFQQVPFHLIEHITIPPKTDGNKKPIV